VRRCGVVLLIAFATAGAAAPKPPKRTPELIEQGKAV